MSWRLWNRGRGPDLPDLAGRSVKKGAASDVALRPGQSRIRQRVVDDKEEDVVEEMGDLERAARSLKLPENPGDVRLKRAEPKDGRNGAERFGHSTSKARSPKDQPAETEDWNGSSFCPAQFHPKSLTDLVQKNLQNFYQQTNSTIGGRWGKLLDPNGFFADAENDKSEKFARTLYRDPFCYPRW